MGCSRCYRQERKVQELDRVLRWSEMHSVPVCSETVDVPHTSFGTLCMEHAPNRRSKSGGGKKNGTSDDVQLKLTRNPTHRL